MMDTTRDAANVSPALICENLKVSYAGGRAPVLDGLSLEFRPRALTALVGPNGCGKSTLLKAIMGFLPLGGGRVTLGGTPLRRLSRRAMARRIGYLPQECECPEYMNLGELVSLGHYARRGLFGGPGPGERERFQRALDQVGLTAQARTPMSQLSGGQRQRAWIAMVLAQDTEVLLLDEPVNHLDLKYQFQLMSLIRHLVEFCNRTVICVLHDVNLAATFADEVVMLRDGRLVAHGSADGVLTAHSLERVFDVHADVFERQGRRVCLPHRPARGVTT